MATRSPSFEIGTFDHHSGASQAYSFDVTKRSYSSPSVSTSRAIDITDENNPSTVTGTVLTGTASITTTTYTTPTIRSLTAGNTYRIETDITDDSGTDVLVTVWTCPY